MGYIPMTPAPRASSFTVERAALAPALAFLAKAIVEKRNTIPILSNVLVHVGAASVTFTATDLDMSAAWTVPAYVDALGSRFTVDAAMLADLAKGADKGALVTLDYDPAAARVTVTHGRARMTLATLPADDMPALVWRDLAPVDVDAAQLATDMARLLPFTSKNEARYYLNGINVAADGAGGMTMTATTGTDLARITRPLPAGLEALSPLAGAIIPRKAVAVIAKALKGATGAARLAIGADRVSVERGGLVITSKLVDGTFPDTAHVFARLEGAQRLALIDLATDLPAAIVEAFRKAVGAVPDVAEGRGAFGLTFPGAPEFLGVIAVDRREDKRAYGFGYGSTAALDYLADLAAGRGFDLERFTVAAREAEGGGAPVTLVTGDGIVRGATWGHVTQSAAKAGAQIGSREATEAEIDEYCAKMGEGMRALIERDGRPVFAECDTPAQYVPGAFSIAMPRERAEAVCSAVRFTAEDGTVYPLRVANAYDSATGAIELSAEAVRRLAGDVDPSTFVVIPPTQFHRGAVLAEGLTLPTPPRIAKADALRMTAAEMAAFAAACAPVGVALPAPVAVEAPAAVTPPPAPVEPVEPVALPVEPAPAAVAPTGDVADLTARLAALEAVVARLTRPVAAGKRVRSEAERRAVLRAWRMRGEARARADLDRRALEAANGAYRGIVDAYATVSAERDDARKALEALRITERCNARMASDALAAADAADRRAGRMVRAAVRHRTGSRRLAADLRGSQAEARALARRVEGAGVRQRVAAVPAMIATDSGAVAARAD